VGGEEYFDLLKYAKKTLGDIGIWYRVFLHILGDRNIEKKKVDIFSHISGGENKFSIERTPPFNRSCG
jgi:hypothetical protein